MMLKNNIVSLLFSVLFVALVVIATRVLISLFFRVMLIFKENIPFAFSLHDFWDAVEFGAVFGSALGLVGWLLAKLHQHKPNWF